MDAEKDKPDPDIAARISECIERVGGRPAAAKLLGVSLPGLRKWAVGEARAPIEPIAKLAAASGVSLDWVATGVEPISEATVLIPRFAPDASGNPARQPFDADTLIVHRDFFPLQRLDAAKTGVVRVVGDAMAPNLPEGTLVVIDMRSTMIQDDALYVIGQPGRAIVRRAVFSGEALRLVATNPDIEPIIVAPGATMPRVWGRVALTVKRA